MIKLFFLAIKINGYLVLFCAGIQEMILTKNVLITVAERFLFLGSSTVGELQTLFSFSSSALVQSV